VPPADRSGPGGFSPPGQKIFVLKAIGSLLTRNSNPLPFPIALDLTAMCPRLT
jgi:hypothetical protein